MKSERFTINHNNYFYVDTMRYQRELYVNLRSLKVFVEGITYTTASPEIRDTIKNYLSYQSNIDQINKISERLNHKRWFNTRYMNESIDTSNPSNLPIVTPNAKGTYASNDLVSSLLVISPNQYELNDLDELSYHPIYKFFGGSRIVTTIHCIHFDILMSILMKTLPFRSELIRLMSVELEYAKITNSSIDDITETKLYKLRKESERAELTRQISEQNKLIRDLVQQNIAQAAKIDEQFKQNNDLINISDASIKRMNDKLITIDYLVHELHKEVYDSKAKPKKLFPISETTTTTTIKDKPKEGENDMIILYTTTDKPKDINLREGIPANHSWVCAYHGQWKRFQGLSFKNKQILYKIETTDPDVTCKRLSELDSINKYIVQKTPYKDWLINNESMNDLFNSISYEINRV